MNGCIYAIDEKVGSWLKEDDEIYRYWSLLLLYCFVALNMKENHKMGGGGAKDSLSTYSTQD